MNFGSNVRGGDRVIVRRRIEENKLASLQTAVQKNYHLGSIARWEQSSEKLMFNKEEERKLLKLEIEKTKDLERRKLKLRELLKNDELIYKSEIDNKLETPKERRLRLEKKAFELKEKRLRRKEEFIKQQRLKQFRLKCDELRLNKGQNLTFECDRVRKQQINEKLLKKEFQEKENKKWLKIWNNELQKKIDREKKESEYKKNLNYDTAKLIKEQIKNKEIKMNDIKNEKQKEIEDRVNLLNESKEKAKLDDIRKNKELELKRKEMRSQYEQYQNKKIAEKEYEKKMDKEFIEKVLNKEKKESLNKKQKQNENANDIKNYLEYLNQLKLKEKENENLLNKLREKELENEWIKKEIKWKKEDLARNQLLKNVVNGRMDQIAYKNTLKFKETQKSDKDTNKILADIKQYQLNEKKKVDDRLKYNKEIQNFLRQQIAEKQENEIKQKTELLSFNVNDEIEKKEYKKLLKEEMESDKNSLQQGISMSHHPKTTANWWTY